MSREDAYSLVQRHAMATIEDGGNFADRLKADPAVTQRLPTAEIDALFDHRKHIRHVDTIFRRVFGRA